MFWLMALNLLQHTSFKSEHAPLQATEALVVALSLKPALTVSQTAFFFFAHELMRYVHSNCKIEYALLKGIVEKA